MTLITHNSDSTAQNDAQKVLISILNNEFNCEFNINVKFVINDDNAVACNVDFVSDDSNILCEFYAHIGPLKPGHKRKITNDVLKMLTIEKAIGTTYQKYLLVICDEVYNSITKHNSWLAHSLNLHKINVKMIKIPVEFKSIVAHAQAKQYMTNMPKVMKLQLIKKSK